MKRTLYVTGLLLLFLFCTCGKRNIRKITVADYLDKMKAAWVGQMAGVGWGGPTEFNYKGQIVPLDQIPEWKPEMINQYKQDDIYVEMTFIRALEMYGFEIPIRQAGIEFANSQYRLWHANQAGRDNLRSGIAPPFSGHPEYNKHADDIDYQIEADFSGIIAPGLPQAVVDMGEIFGRLINYGDGLYGGQFVGGMYAEAFFTNDMEKIVETGLRCIPVESLYYKTISDVLRWYRENPEDWERTWHLINDKYHLNRENRKFSCSNSNPDFNIDAKLNGAYIVMGLLYGEGDPDKTIILSTRCGQDSDCNPSNAAGILFTTMGFSKLPDRFTSGIDPEPRFSYTEYSFPDLLSVCEKLARVAVLRYGGHIEKDAKGHEVFVIPSTSPETSGFEQCWNPNPAVGDVRYSDSEMDKIEYPPQTTGGMP